MNQKTQDDNESYVEESSHGIEISEGKDKSEGESKGKDENEGNPLSAEVEANVKATIGQIDSDTYVRKSPGGKYIIEYKKDMCIGAASCAAIAPFTFEMDDEENIADLISSEDGQDEDDVILAAAQSCPVFAIIIKDAETGEQLFPPTE